MAAVNVSLMAVNGVSLLQRRTAVAVNGVSLLQRRTAVAVNGVSLLQRGPAERSIISRGLRVKCMAEPKESNQFTSNRKVSTKFEDVFAFGGPAPETINGRLAMLGFVSAVGVEIASGRDLFSQVANGGGVPLFLGSAVLLSVASLIPMFKGVSAESKSQEIMSSRAEMWNGRFAMVGLIALAITEYLKGGPLIS